MTSVTGHMSVVDDIFQEGFALTLYYSTQKYTSLADDCKIQKDGSVTASNLTGTCGHTPSHELTRTGVETEFINDNGKGTASSANILWTGHILDGNPPSAAYTTHRVIINTPKMVVDGNSYENISSKYQKESRYTLMHELSHILGTHDHYCFKDFGTDNKCSNKYCWPCREAQEYPDGFPNELMYSRFNIETVEFKGIYCFDCIKIITEGLYGHH